MPREKSSTKDLHGRWVKELGVTDQFELDGSKFYCQPCSTSYNFGQKKDFCQHLKTTIHTKNAIRFKARPERQVLLNHMRSQNHFYTDLCKAMVSANIPFFKLDNPYFSEFLEKYTKQNIPHRTTLAKNYLPQVYASVRYIAEIRREIGQRPVWFAIDETTDSCGRYIGNVLVGALDKEIPTKCHIIAYKQLEKTNHSTIVQLLQDSFQILWPGTKQAEIDAKFLLLLTDAVNYMLKSGKVLKETYPNLFHVTCLAHALNRVAEEIRSAFPEVDSLVASLKAVFKISPSRVAKFKELNPGLDLPPEPMITRWGTWLNTVEYYANNFDEVKKVIDSLDRNDAASIRKSHELMQSSVVRQQLAFLSANYTFLVPKIDELQQKESSLKNSFETWFEVRRKISTVHGEIGNRIFQKFMAVEDRNPDLSKLKICNAIIQGIDVSEEEAASIILSPNSIAALKLAPVTTTNTERSFSIHKYILSDRRQNMTTSNLEMSLICNMEL